jgi:DNA-binding SARP family transcriptional activator
VSSISFRLLGPLEVRIADRTVRLASPRQQVVLAMLLLEANHVVAMARMIDAVWDDDPPTTAKAQIQMCVSALRRLLDDGGGADLIVTQPPGYVIRVADEALDIRQFLTLAARGRAASADGRPAEAAAALRAALELWRGQAADGIHSEVVQGAAVALNENRRAVLGDRLELELQLGRHYEVMGEIQGAVTEYPLDERLRRLQMLALYRAGRQASALQAFRDARELLLEELGLDPSQETRALEQAILSNDASLATAAPPPVSPVPRQLPAAVADFTGRADASQLLCSYLMPARGSTRVPVLALTGQGGVGKTALALEVAHRVSKEFPDGQLYAALHGTTLQGRSTENVLESFLRSFGIDPLVIPESADEKTVMFRSRLAERRVLVVLDDVGSFTAVQPLIPGSATCAVIMTTRNRLGGLPGVRLVEIQEFDHQTSLDLLAKVIGAERVDAEEVAAQRLVELCGRLPLALRIISAKLAARPHWTLRQMVNKLEDGKHRLDELNLDGFSVRNTIAFSYEGLGPPSRRLLARLCMLGPESFPSWVIAPLMDMDIDTAADVLDDLVTARLVEVRVAGASVRYELHDFVRLFAMENLANDAPTEEHQAALARLLSCWLFLAGVAHRRMCGGDFGLLHGTAPLWRLPKDVADELLSDPLAWLQDERRALVTAISQAARAGLDEICWDLATTSVTLFEIGCYVGDWQDTHEIALAAVLRSGNRRGEAAVRCSLGTLALTRQPDEAAPQLSSALETFTELGDVHGQAIALGQSAFLDRLRGAIEEAAIKYQRALGLYREFGDMVGEIDMLRGLARTSLIRDRDDAAEELLVKAVRLSELLPAHRVRAQTIYELGELFLKHGDLARAESSFGEALGHAEASNDVVGQAYAFLGIGTIYGLRGEYALATEKLELALELTEGTAHLLIRGRIMRMLADTASQAGNLDKARIRIEAAREIFSALNLDFAPQPERPIATRKMAKFAPGESAPIAI